MNEYVHGTSAYKDTSKIIAFPGAKKEETEIIDIPKGNGNYKANYKTGEKQEVYPFRKKEDLKLMYNYFIEKKHYRDAMMFVVGINVGLRAGDLLALKWEQVLEFNGDSFKVVDGISIKEEKTDKFRTFYLNSSCKKAITEYYCGLKKKPESSEYIFKSRKGNSHIEVRPAGLILKKAAQAVGLKYNVGTHSMRKTFGYWQLKAHQGDAIFLCELQEMFNHSSPKITLRYCGLEAEKMEQYYNDVNLLLDDVDESDCNTEDYIEKQA